MNTQQDKLKDTVVLVSENDQVLGSMDKIEAHRGTGALHRAISVFLFRENAAGERELLIQQRSEKKIVGALQWANTVCGNVWPGESYEECAARRLQFELGLSATQVAATELQDVFTFRYQVACNAEFGENEMDHIFVGSLQGEPTANRDEVAATEWHNWEKLRKGESTKDLAPWFVMMLNTPELVASCMKNEV